MKNVSVPRVLGQWGMVGEKSGEFRWIMRREALNVKYVV